MKLSTSYIYPPIPPREFDWSAMFDCDDGDSGRVGFGRTEQEACLDLLANQYEALVSIALDEFDAYAANPFDTTLAAKAAEFNEIKDTMALLRIAETAHKPGGSVPEHLIQRSRSTSDWFDSKEHLEEGVTVAAGSLGSRP